ncbi:LacI family transcriptional regulator, partial [bacterium]
VDDARGMEEVVRHLAEKGHGRIDFVMSPAQPVSARRRRDAFLAECDRFGIRAVVRCFRDGDPAEFLRDSLALKATVIVCWNDYTAHQLLQSASTAGVRVPEDLAIAGFDGITPPTGFASPLTTVVAPWAEAARTAVFQLDALLRGEAVATETVLPVRFRVGTTT